MGLNTHNIRCPIHGSIPFSKSEFRLINSPFLQRLRHISQLGFVSLVFPGAVHTRFAHSLGTAHLAGLIFDQLRKTSSPLLEKYYTKEQINYFRKILRFAALLHDVGHLPFSHAVESLLPDITQLQLPTYLGKPKGRKAAHEDISHSIIYYMAEQQKLLTHNEAYDIISILTKKLPPSTRMQCRNGNPLIYHLLKQLVSGEIDADRMDYLLRDSYFAGVPYGAFDLDRMVSSISCFLEESLNCFLLVIDGEAVPTYENFLLARGHMFYHIYFHKSLSVFGYYLKQAIEKEEIKIKVSGNVEEYLNLTENTIHQMLQKAKDQKWSGKLFNRIPAKNLIRVMDGDPQKILRLQQIKKLLQKNGIEVMLTHSANQYSTQIRGTEVNESSIMVRNLELGQITVRPLAECSPLLEAEQKQIEIYQLYLHRPDYEKAIRLLKS
jgi:HD superfamily phosphohydrolase